MLSFPSGNSEMSEGNDSLLQQANTPQNGTPFAPRNPVTPDQTPGAPSQMIGQAQSMTTQRPKPNGKHY